MKQLQFFAAIIFLAFSLLTSCKMPGVEAGQELVLVQKPFIFGSGGIVQEPIKSGRPFLALSTEYVKYNMKPVKYTEKFDDVITFDNNPVDFAAYIQIQIKEGKSPELHSKYGEKWYINNIEEQFRASIRNKCGKFKMFTLSTDRQIVDSLEDVIHKEMEDYAQSIQIPIDIKQVIIGQVTPPGAVLLETEKTAAEIQKVKTQDARNIAEQSRKAADISKAEADMAYMNTFKGMTVNQYLYLRKLEIEKEKVDMVKTKKNVSIIMSSGGNDPINTIPIK